VSLPRIVQAGVVLVLAVLACGAVALGYGVLAHFALSGPVTPAALGKSVARKAGASDTGPCAADRRVARRWDCGVWEQYGSSGIDYTVVVERGTSCWRARRSPGASSNRPQSMHGCVKRWEW
jgi:hypothetical protein